MSGGRQPAGRRPPLREQLRGAEERAAAAEASAAASAAAAAAELGKLRNEAVSLRQRAKEAERERDEHAATTAAEREQIAALRARAEEAERAARTRGYELAAERVAQRLGAIRAGSPELAAKMLDRDQVDFDPETGLPDPESLEVAMRATLREYGMLTYAGPADAGEGGAGNGALPRPGTGEWLTESIRQTAREMKARR